MSTQKTVINIALISDAENLGNAKNVIHHFAQKEDKKVNSNPPYVLQNFDFNDAFINIIEIPTDENQVDTFLNTHGIKSFDATISAIPAPTTAQKSKTLELEKDKEKTSGQEIKVFSNRSINQLNNKLGRRSGVSKTLILSTQQISESSTEKDKRLSDNDAAVRETLIEIIKAKKGLQAKSSIQSTSAQPEKHKEVSSEISQSKITIALTGDATARELAKDLIARFACDKSPNTITKSSSQPNDWKSFLFKNVLIEFVELTSTETEIPLPCHGVLWAQTALESELKIRSDEKLTGLEEHPYAPLVKKIDSTLGFDYTELLYFYISENNNDNDENNIQKATPHDTTDVPKNDSQNTTVDTTIKLQKKLQNDLGAIEKCLNNLILNNIIQAKILPPGNDINALTNFVNDDGTMQRAQQLIATYQQLEQRSLSEKTDSAQNIHPKETFKPLLWYKKSKVGLAVCIMAMITSAALFTGFALTGLLLTFWIILPIFFLVAAVGSGIKIGYDNRASRSAATTQVADNPDSKREGFTTEQANTQNETTTDVFSKNQSKTRNLSQTTNNLAQHKGKKL